MQFDENTTVTIFPGKQLSTNMYHAFLEKFIYPILQNPISFHIYGYKAQVNISLRQYIGTQRL